MTQDAPTPSPASLPDSQMTIASLGFTSNHAATPPSASTDSALAPHQAVIGGPRRPTGSKITVDEWIWGEIGVAPHDPYSDCTNEDTSEDTGDSRVEAANGLDSRDHSCRSACTGSAGKSVDDLDEVADIRARVGKLENTGNIDYDGESEVLGS